MKEIVRKNAGVYSMSLTESDRGCSVAFQKKIQRDGKWEKLTIYLALQDVVCVRKMCEEMEMEIESFFNMKDEEEPTQEAAAEGPF